MPRPNTLEHQIIWWTPTIGDVSCPPNSGPVSGLWKLCQPKYNELRTAVMFLTDRVAKYRQSSPPEQRSSTLQPPMNLQPPMKWIQQVLDQLHTVHMSMRYIEFVVRDLQRMWLHVWAILDYMEIYRPRINGNAPPAAGVADTMGTFTTSIRVAQDMFLAGLPCWLIRESALFCDQKIFRIAEIFDPKDYVVMGPHKFNYPVIFKGPAEGLEKFTAIELFARNFLRCRDPFAMTSTPSSLAGASQPEASTSSISSTPPVASSSSTQPSTGRNSRGVARGVAHRPGRGRGAGKSLAFNIYQHYYINSLIKVLNNHPAIKGVTNSSQSRSSPLHRCRSLPGPVPWLLLMTIPLTWMSDIAQQMIESMFSQSLAFSLAPMRCDGRSTSSLGRQLSQPAFIDFCHPRRLPSPIKNGGKFLSAAWNLSHRTRHVRRLRMMPVGC